MHRVRRPRLKSWCVPGHPRTGSIRTCGKIHALRNSMTGTRPDRRSPPVSRRCAEHRHRRRHARATSGTCRNGKSRRSPIRIVQRETGSIRISTVRECRQALRISVSMTTRAARRRSIAHGNDQDKPQAARLSHRMSRKPSGVGSWTDRKSAAFGVVFQRADDHRKALDETLPIRRRQNG